MKRFELLVLGGLAVAAVAGCGGGPKPEPPAPAVGPNADSIAAAERARQDSIERAQQEARAREEAERAARQRAADSLAAIGRTTEAARTLLATMIHFDFDKSNIRSDDAGVLDQKAGILQTNPNLRIRVAGNCDERGSDEYNLALGNRRAISARQYLVSHGVDGGRIETVSYGKERPLDPGHNEAAWAKNRNDQFEIVSGGDVLKQP
ncbi:MAG TPA: peptidoglycan-associated lipoprotein Pal [Gemmatimonadales bacterium]|nr:peptidoglycan-associated lipoprotein Pal [Gemmatimonadales bacterium]